MVLAIRSFERGFRRVLAFWRDLRGVAAVEFAIMAPVLILTVAGIMEVSMVLAVSSLLEGGLRDAARYGITGYVPAGTTREDQIKAIIGDATIGLVDMNNANIQTLIYPSFGDIGQPEPYDDQNANGVYDIGEPFTDINSNGQWDPDMGAAGLGGPGEIVLYKITYDLGMMTPLLSPIMGGSDGKVTLRASIAVRNEPYPTTAGTGGGT
ncbi:MAG TPA: TadE/TadG family type IV pilus assembly protein [Alphaproteobacteria bacterium]|nr:TadE/TadG family type IV pilus assembly protein [Alphaproteobacteria bacterium]